jgi:hypothetical protein
MEFSVAYTRVRNYVNGLNIGIVILSAGIGFALIAYFSLAIIASINSFALNLSSRTVSIFFVLLLPFFAGGLFSIVIDRSISSEKIYKSMLENHCILCLLPLKNNVITCEHCRSKFHSWHLLDSPLNVNSTCIRCTSQLTGNNLSTAVSSTRNKEKINNLVIIDGTNLAFETKPPCLKYIQIAQEALLAYGFETICFVSSALKYRIKETEQFLREIKAKRIIEAPAKSYDDRFILETAKKFNGWILSNDQFRDLTEYADEVLKRRITYSFVKDEIIIAFTTKNKEKQ